MSNDLEDGLNIRTDDIVWMKNGKVHREDGPAIEHAYGATEWWRDGLRHREDGPAIECADGLKRWFLNGEEVTEEEFNQWLAKKQLNEKLQTNLQEKSSIKRGKI